MEHKVKTGTLYIVATPIGNLSDISLRALEVLKRVDAIYCEDTRHSRKLTQAHAIGTPLQAYHEHNAQQQRPKVLDALAQGHSIALISDAGTPLISDPGYKLVSDAKQQGAEVIPIPGACAAITALSAAGLPSDRFLFVGFLSSKQKARQQELMELKALKATLIFYESPKRLATMLQDAHAVLGGERMAVVARELTKTYETIQRMPLAELEQYYVQGEAVKGEIVVLIEGAARQQKTYTEAELTQLLQELLQEHSVKQAAQLAAEMTSCPKRDCYQLALKVKHDAN